MKKYWLIIISLQIIGFTPLLFSYYFLANLNETASVDEIVERQIRENAIYGAALVGSPRASYVGALCKAIDPDVLALGSSRVMNLRSLAFEKPFVNGGGVVSSVSDLAQFVDHYLLKELKKPKLIILQIDYWWYVNLVEKIKPYQDDHTIDLQDLIKPLKAVFDGNLSKELFIKGLSVEINESNFYEYPALGVGAVGDGFGYRRDGSLIPILTNLTDYPSENKIDYGQLLNDHASSFRTYHGRALKDFQKLFFKNTLQKLKKHGYQVIVTVPPVARVVIENMLKDEREARFLKEFENYLDDISKIYPVYNLHDFRKVYDDDCEFLDGFHGGEVTALRIIKYIGKTNTLIRSFYDERKLDQLIEKYQGRVFITDKNFKINYKEIDFLKLGCKK